MFLSTRRGSWILNRVGDNGFPMDMRFSRLMHILMAILPINLTSMIGERGLNRRFNHKLYSIKPKHRCVSIGGLFKAKLTSHFAKYIY